jgi:hypothetical protein
MFRAKHLILIIFILIIFLAFFYGVVPFEDGLLDSLVSTGPAITLDEWREAFRNWATVGIVVALAAALLWFVLGQWFVSLNHWAGAGKRGLWLALLVVSLLAGAPGAVLTPTTQEWGRLSVAFYVANNCLLYYLATLLFSPPSYKYTPPGAAAVRFW